MTRNSKIYVGHRTADIKDGGMARNNAFCNFAHIHDYKIYNLYDSNLLIRICKTVVLLLESLLWRERSILLHLGTVFLIFPKKILGISAGLKLFSVWLKMVSRKNSIHLEINDLPYEQAVDLDLKIEKFYLNFQKIIFNNDLKLHYIFAAHKMRDFIVSQYDIDTDHTQVIINGAPAFDSSPTNDFFSKYDPSKIRFIYAGTLNRGRGIEDLLNVFEGSSHYLFLMGEEGEWIKGYDNIIHLGGYEENIAMDIVSQCDIGVVHYDGQKTYYNLCYPTKYSFYISAGIPVLSTDLDEARFVLEKYDLTYFIPFKNWRNFLMNLKKEDLQAKSQNARSSRKNFSWGHILKNLRC